jgi:hypothetical protein
VTHEMFNLLLAVAGAPTVVGAVGITAAVLVRRQDPEVTAYILATEPDQTPASKRTAPRQLAIATRPADSSAR